MEKILPARDALKFWFITSCWTWEFLCCCCCWKCCCCWMLVSGRWDANGICCCAGCCGFNWPLIGFVRWDIVGLAMYCDGIWCEEIGFCMVCFDLVGLTGLTLPNAPVSALCCCCCCICCCCCNSNWRLALPPLTIGRPALSNKEKKKIYISVARWPLGNSYSNLPGGCLTTVGFVQACGGVCPVCRRAFCRFKPWEIICIADCICCWTCEFWLCPGNFAGSPLPVMI